MLLTSFIVWVCLTHLYQVYKDVQRDKAGVVLLDIIRLHQFQTE